VGSDGPVGAANGQAAAIVARLSRAEAVRRMAAEWRSQIPALRPGLRESEQEIVEGLTRNITRWWRFLRTGTMPPENSFDALRAWARARAAEGMRLEDLLRAFSLAHRVGWGLLRAHAKPEEAHALIELAGLLAEYHDRVSAVVTQTYLSEREVLVSEVERDARSLLDALWREQPLTPAQRELAERIGVPLAGGLRPFVVVMPGRMRHRQAALAARLRSAGQALAVTEGDAVLGLSWAELDLTDLGLGAEALLAIGEPAADGRLAAAREEVALLAEHGRVHGLTGRLLTHDYAFEIMLARSPWLTARLREQVLAPLRREDHAELARTLRTLVRCRLDRTATSEALHVHRNTLAYRLRRIEEIVGLDLGDPRDLACAYVAVTTAPAPDQAAA
jgi:hypothetical protein